MSVFSLAKLPQTGKIFRTPQALLITGNWHLVTIDYCVIDDCAANEDIASLITRATIPTQIVKMLTIVIGLLLRTDY